ncbi:hypothetical protein C7212DRAFT_309436 [Tuber magnatum]|uniref:F-box domain-containing protein n=1 Tax=Tuber magnatum TaxID=42249 RepID=A0A317SYI4_9PEZI|nr:hypothetical protein C7212DRAFT_309436 [Tuber magnatum]
MPGLCDIAALILRFLSLPLHCLSLLMQSKRWRLWPRPPVISYYDTAGSIVPQGSGLCRGAVREGVLFVLS